MRFLGSLFLFLIICISAGAAEQPFKFTIVTEDVPPMQIVQEGKVISGITVEIVSAIFKQANLSPKFLVLPWPRAYQQALNEPNVFIFSMIRNPAREDDFVWLNKIFTIHANITVLKSRTDILLTEPADFFQYMIGVSRGDFGDEYMQSIGLKEGKNLYLTIKHENMWKMLFNGRVDAVFTNDVTAKSEIISAGYAPELAHNVYSIKDVSTDLYLAANKQSDPQLIELLRKSYTKIKENGELDEILTRWRSSTKLANGL